MKTSYAELPPLGPDIEALLEFERVIPPQPDELRSRAFARARASLALTGLPPVPRAPRFFSPQLLMAAGLALVVLGAAGAALYKLVAQSRHVSPPTSAEVAPVPVPAAPQAAPAQATETPGESATGPGEPVANSAPSLSPVHERGARPKSVARNTLDMGDFGVELRLLQRARESMAKGQFAEALAPIADHERRFPTGRLVEEREALRVRALSGLGRTQESKRAAADFRTRFPRSVLLSRMNDPSGSGPP
jgi:hypothetical protein